MRKDENRKGSFLGVPVLIDILNVVDLLLYGLGGDTVGLQFVNLLVNQVRGGLVKKLQEVLDHLGNDVVRLLVLILTLVCQIRFGITCRHDRLLRSFPGSLY